MIRAFTSFCVKEDSEFLVHQRAVMRYEDIIAWCDSQQETCSVALHSQPPESTGVSSMNGPGTCSHAAAEALRKQAMKQRDVLSDRIYNDEIVPEVIQVANDARIKKDLLSLYVLFPSSHLVLRLL